MPQLDFSTIYSQLFWLTVCFVLLYLLMSRVALPRVAGVLQTRKDRVSTDLDAAERSGIEAEKLQKKYEASFADTRRKANETIAAARQQLKEMATREHDALSASLVKQLEDAEVKMAAMRGEAVEKVSGIATELCESAVQKIAGLKPKKTAIEAEVKSLSSRKLDT